MDGDTTIISMYTFRLTSCHIQYAYNTHLLLSLLFYSDNITAGTMNVSLLKKVMAVATSSSHGQGGGSGRGRGCDGGSGSGCDGGQGHSLDG